MAAPSVARNKDQREATSNRQADSLDSIQTPRARILGLIPDDADISRPDVARLTGLANSTVGWVASELLALGVIKVDSQYEDRYSFTVDFQELRRKAGLVQ